MPFLIAILIGLGVIAFNYGTNRLCKWIGVRRRVKAASLKRSIYEGEYLEAYVELSDCINRVNADGQSSIDLLYQRSVLDVKTSRSDAYFVNECGDGEFQQRYQFAYQRAEYAVFACTLPDQVTRWRAASEFDTRLLLALELIKIIRRLQTPNQERFSTELAVTTASIQADCATTIRQHCDRLCMAAPVDPAAFNQLRLLIPRTLKKKYSKAELDFGDPLEYPDHWNDWVALHVPNPVVDDFISLPGYSVGEMRLLAAKALAESNLIEAKTVLAYCNREVNHYNPIDWQTEVGGLADQLAQFVSSENERLASQAPTS